jgi:hypothetical protein
MVAPFEHPKLGTSFYRVLAIDCIRSAVQAVKDKKMGLLKHLLI